MIESELMGVFEQIEREKGISKKDLLVMIETALCSAFRKHSGKGYVFEAHIDSETGIITAYTKKKVVGEVMNDNFQISCEAAKKIDAAAKEGDEELENAKALASELSGPYRDVKKAIRQKTKYVIGLLTDKGAA